jgi:AP-3 complex subunit beta
MHGDSILPEWLEAGIDPALRQNDEDVAPLALPSQAISSAGSSLQRALGSVGATSVVLTPTGNSTPSHDTKESWRDLDKFYASDSDKRQSESSSEEQGSEGEGDQGDKSGEDESEDDEDEDVGDEDESDEKDGEEESAESGAGIQQ